MRTSGAFAKKKKNRARFVVLCTTKYLQKWTIKQLATARCSTWSFEHDAISVIKESIQPLACTAGGTKGYRSFFRLFLKNKLQRIHIPAGYRSTVLIWVPHPPPPPPILPQRTNFEETGGGVGGIPLQMSSTKFAGNMPKLPSGPVPRHQPSSTCSMLVMTSSGSNVISVSSAGTKPQTKFWIHISEYPRQGLSKLDWPANPGLVKFFISIPDPATSTSLYREKLGPFVLFSTMWLRHFGREPLSYDSETNCQERFDLIRDQANQIWRTGPGGLHHSGYDKLESSYNRGPNCWDDRPFPPLPEFNVEISSYLTLCGGRGRHYRPPTWLLVSESDRLNL